MPYRICKQVVVENGHMLSKHADACKFPHGHTRTVEFVLEADELDQNDMVCDFKAVTDAVGAFVDSFDHAMCMNTDDPQHDSMKSAYGERILSFEKVDPTTEVIAKKIFDECKSGLQAYAEDENAKYPVSSRVRLVRVRVWETPSSWAEYREE